MKQCHWCGRKVDILAKECPSCGCETLVEMQTPRPRTGREGIRGWLFVFLITFAMSLVWIPLQIFWQFLELKRASGLETAPPGFRAAAWSVIISNAVLFACVIHIIPRFIRKKAGTANEITGLVIVALLLSGVPFLIVRVTGAGAGGAFQGPGPNLAEHGEIGILIAFTRAAIWVPYFSLSKRVRATFVN